MKMFKHLVCSLFIIALLYSCKDDSSKNSKLKVFRYNESSGISSLDPAFAKDQSNIWVCNQLYNGLVQLNDQLKVEPCIAKSWNISTDGKEYTFYLRSDVMFHESVVFPNKTRRVTAHDFVYSLNRLADSKLAAPGAWVMNDVERKNEKLFIEALNDTVLLICLNEAFPAFLGLLTMQYCSVIPKEAVDFYGIEFRKHPVGTGPFQLKLWKENTKLVLAKNPHYFEKEGNDRLPYLDAVAITFMIDKQSAFLEFVKGKLDFMSGIDASYKDELLTSDGKLNPKYDEKIKLITQPYLNTEYLGFLVDKDIAFAKESPISKKAIRQAINYGIDRNKMMRYLRNNIGTPACYGFIPKGMPSFDTSKVKGYTYDPGKALKLLADAGFPNGQGLPEIRLSTSASYMDLCQHIQHELNEIGIKIKIDVNPPATLREMVAQSKLNFFRGSWIADYPDAENYLLLFYSKNFCPKGPNYTHFSSKKYDLLYERAMREVNDSMRYRYYQEMDQLIIDEAPVVVLYYDQVLRFVQNNVAGLESNAMNLLNLKRVKKL